MIYVFLMLLILNYGNIFSQSAIHVLEGESVLHYIPVSKDILSCNITVREKGKSNTNVTIGLDLNSENITVPPVYQDMRNFSTRLSSLGVGYCGFRLTNVKKTDPEDWILSKETNASGITDVPFRIVYFGLDNRKLIQKVRIGSITTINCGRPETQSQEFCQVYNPSGELMSESVRCSLLRPMVTMSDLGVWRCVSGVPQSMNTLEYFVELISAEPTENEGWVIETDRFYKIGCRLASAPKSDFCRIVDPTDQEFIVRSNLATERYTSLQTDLSNNTCGIEIPKPLLAHERGTWKCIIANQGSLLNVSNVTGPRYTKAFSVVVEVNSPFSIHCEVPYVTQACYILSPNRTRYSPDIPTRAQLGECSLLVKKASETDDGEWSCFYIKKNEIAADEVKFQVSVHHNLTCTSEVKVDKGSTAELSCKTNRVNMQYCWFMSPQGEVYHLFNEYSSERLAYFGRGLEYGDCGIALFNVQEAHYGNWSCIFRRGIDYWKQEEVYSLRLSPLLESEIHQASSFGILLGVILGIALTAALILFKRYRQKQKETLTTTAEVALPLNSSHN